MAAAGRKRSKRLLLHRRHFPYLKFSRRFPPFFLSLCGTNSKTLAGEIDDGFHSAIVFGGACERQRRERERERERGREREGLYTVLVVLFEALSFLSPCSHSSSHFSKKKGKRGALYMYFLRTSFRSFLH